MLAEHYRLMEKLATCCAHVIGPMDPFDQKYAVEYGLFKPVDLKKLVQVFEDLLLIQPCSRLEGKNRWILEVMNLPVKRTATPFRVKKCTPNAWMYIAETN